MRRDGSNLRVMVLHGAHGGPDTNWFPWLRSELSAQGIEVIVPRFPTPEGQSLQAWFDAYDRATNALPAVPTMIVGHSLGAAFALRLVERADKPFEGLLLASGFVGALDLPDYDPINASFFVAPFDWTGIRERRGRICRCWAGDDDPYVPLPRSQDVADHLHAPLEVIGQGGHLNSETGFNTFPHLRDAILNHRATALAG
jgi:predicted alpha/beta hydrolase family esterase